MQSSEAISPLIHSWLRKVRLAYIPGPTTPLLESFVIDLLESFHNHGHEVENQPGGETDVLLTTAGFGEPLSWRRALLFTGRRRLHLDHLPTLFTLVHATPAQFRAALAVFDKALAKEPPNPADYELPGMAATAYHTLHEQGRRGGPILSLIRMVQSQAKCIRIILVIGEDHPEEAYTFDLVGAHPRTSAADPQAFYQDLMLRILTAACTNEVTAHEIQGEAISFEAWKALSTPPAMLAAGIELGKRHFFTEMVQVDRLVNVPAVGEAIADQYSEGCFATWEPALGALITTITGSARPVDKGNLTDDELAVIIGSRPDGEGVFVRQVQGKRNDPPSSEAVEMMEMDSVLPKIGLGREWGSPQLVPVVRSRLHGHRGVNAYDPRRVEHVYLDEPYYHYPVSCSTQAQVFAVRSAFARAEALQNPGDPRQIVFTILPGHGVLIVEKWVAGKLPFELIWEAMDDDALQIHNLIPQGALTFRPGVDGRMKLVELPVP